MFEVASKRNRFTCFLCLVGLLVVLMPICLSVATDRAVTAQKERSINARPTELSRAAALRAATKTATKAFEPSLEMKENVDFLLTPALIVQEALSEDVIKTYPSE
jgi:hypothetical protein